jgi:Bacterial Ig-like domain (group 3)
LPPGANSITAVYVGDSNNSGSTSAPVNQFVLQATTTTLSSSPNPSAYGQTVVFTARVTSSIGTPPDGETVTFKQGMTILGTGTLSGGTATFPISTLGVGTKWVTAVYAGDSTFASSSKTMSQVVNQATTTTTLVSSLNPSQTGQSATFTASVAPQFSGTPGGYVTFYDGTTVLKTVYMSGGTAKFTTSTLATGTHTITGTYNGNANFAGSSASLTQTVD